MTHIVYHHTHTTEHHKNKGYCSTHRTYHLLIHGFGDGVPRLVIFNVTVIGMVCSVADTPTMVGHQDGCMCDVANQIVQGFVVGKALMATVTSGWEVWLCEMGNNSPSMHTSRDQPRTMPKTWCPVQTSTVATQPCRGRGIV